MTPDISVREYQPDDLENVIAVFLAAVQQVATRDYPPEQIAAWAQVDRAVWRKRLLNSQMWLAIGNQQIAGFINLESNGHLDLLFVHPAWQRMGVASLLLTMLEKAAVEQSLPTIFTEASITAKPFFTRCGFQLLEQQQVLVRGQRLTNYRMRKVLIKDEESGSR